MQLIETEYGEVDISADMLSQLLKRADSVHGYNPTEGLRRNFKRKMEAIALCIRRKEYSSPRNIRILNAHGNVRNGVHHYYETQNGTRTAYSVEDWIAKHEGDYDALYLHTCNDPKKPQPITPKRCFIVYSNGLHHGNDIFLRAIHRPSEAELQIVPPVDYKPHEEGIRTLPLLMLKMLRRMTEKRAGE